MMRRTPRWRGERDCLQKMHASGLNIQFSGESTRRLLVVSAEKQGLGGGRKREFNLCASTLDAPLSIFVQAFD